VVQTFVLEFTSHTAASKFMQQKNATIISSKEWKALRGNLSRTTDAPPQEWYGLSPSENERVLVSQFRRKVSRMLTLFSKPGAAASFGSGHKSDDSSTEEDSEGGGEEGDEGSNAESQLQSHTVSTVSGVGVGVGVGAGAGVGATNAAASPYKQRETGDGADGADGADGGGGSSSSSLLPLCQSQEGGTTSSGGKRNDSASDDVAQDNADVRTLLKQMCKCQEEEPTKEMIQALGSSSVDYGSASACRKAIAGVAAQLKRHMAARNTESEPGVNAIITLCEVAALRFTSLSTQRQNKMAVVMHALINPTASVGGSDTQDVGGGGGGGGACAGEAEAEEEEAKGCHHITTR
jgi:hypothetical protein